MPNSFRRTYSSSEFCLRSPIYKMLWSKAAKEQKYDWRDYQRVLQEHPEIVPTPFMFGCPDWSHNGNGEVDNWAHTQMPYTEEEKAAMEPPEPRSKQKYPDNELEPSRYRNDRWGWSNMIDKGVMNDYWRMRGKYYSYSWKGAL